LLTEFTVADLTAMSHDELVDVITHRGRGHFDDPDATARMCFAFDVLPDSVGVVLVSKAPW
jgi:hypothetical protein